MYYCTVLKTKGIWSYSFFIDHTRERMSIIRIAFFDLDGTLGIPEYRNNGKPVTGKIKQFHDIIRKSKIR